MAFRKLSPGLTAAREHDAPLPTTPDRRNIHPVPHRIDRLLVKPCPLDRRRGRIHAGPLVIPCALGRSGVSRRKREGDGATPAGVLRPLRAHVRRDRLRPPASVLALRPIGPQDGWCDDPAHPRYNRPVTLPFAASHERLLRDDRLYDIVVELDWNMRPAIRGRGSAIFLHVCRPGFLPTEGCIAVAPAALRRLLPALTPRTRFIVG